MRPNLIIIGAAKCGTNSLHRYLGCHPEVYMSEPKELRFFTKNWHRGLLWYESKFPVDYPVRGESSPQYTVYPMITGTPGRMHSVIPDAKLIYLVRDPIDRVVSAYLERLGQFREDRELETILARFEKSRHAHNQYIHGSKYFRQMEQYLVHYDASRILVITLESLKAARAATLERVFRFLGVDERFRTDGFDVVWNQGSRKRRKSWFGRLIYPYSVRKALHNGKIPYPVVKAYKRVVYLTGRPIVRPSLSSDMIDRLMTTFRDDVRKLRVLTGESFAEWRSY
jgi:hypothetical protein